MLQDLLERGLRVDESILCVVDGGKGIRKALVDVLGEHVSSVPVTVSASYCSA